MKQAVPLEQLRAQVQAVLDLSHEQHADQLAPIGPEMSAFIDPISSLLRGGKRLRAAFCYWGYRAAGGAHSEAIVRVAAAMEVFQAAALLHDDVMDRSDTRRGQPTAHRVLAATHREQGWDGDPDRFGEAAAILAGDLCLNWTDELYSTSGLPAAELARGRAVFDLMRTQLMGGQYLDVLESVRPWESASTQDRVERARLVIRYKSAKYTVEQPLLIGASAYGIDRSTEQALSDYGLALGEAFQLRDDLLGVFGDPEATGKPAGDDLREGKRTVLIAHTLDSCTRPQLARFNELFGRADLDDAGITWLRDLVQQSGAVDAAEAMIRDLSTQADAALGCADLTDEGQQMLRDLIGIAVARSA